MSFWKKNITALMIVLFLTGAIATAFTLFTLQGELVQKSTTISTSDFQPLQPTFNKLYIINGITLLIASITFLIYSSKKQTAIASTLYMGQKNNLKNQGKSAEEVNPKEKVADIDDEALAAISGILESTKEPNKIYDKLLSSICGKLEASQAAIYLSSTEDDTRKVDLTASYAFNIAESKTLSYEFGEGLVGQVAKESKSIHIDNVPEDYIKIFSGLGKATPSHLIISPIITNQGDTYGVIEIASFKAFSDHDMKFVEKAFMMAHEKLGIKEDGDSAAPKIVEKRNDQE